MARKTRIMRAIVRRSFQRRKVQMMKRLPTMEATEEMMVKATLACGRHWRDWLTQLLLLLASSSSSDQEEKRGVYSISPE